MKKLITFIVILFSVAGIAQNKTSKKQHKTTKVVKKSKKAATSNLEGTLVELPDENSIKIDTLYISKGKPCVFLVDVQAGSQEEVQTVGSDQEAEEKELIENFGKNKLEIKRINKHIFVLFENNQTLDISNPNSSFQAMAFWSGKLQDDVQVNEGTRQVTEFVSKHLGINKESSYVFNTRAALKEIKMLQNNEIVTQQSKKVLQLLLDHLCNPLPNALNEDANLLHIATPKIKMVETYFVANKKKYRSKSITFNEQGQPVIIKYYTDKGIESNKIDYTYKDGMLIKATDNKQIVETYTYNKDKIIAQKKVGDAYETNIYWVENNDLLRKGFTIMENNIYSYMNTFLEEKTINKCKNTYINKDLWTINCFSSYDKFPFIHTYTSFQEGKILQFTKSKIEKTGAFIYEKYFSTAQLPEDNDDYKLWGTYFLNDKNLVTTIDFVNGGEKRSVKIEYSFFL